mgnify:CR=1 FL=1
MPLTEKQLAFAAGCNRRWNIKTGATGSGKSWIDYTLIIPQRIIACRGEGLIVLMGNTRGTLERNILEPMRNIWPGLVGMIRADNTVQIFGKRCYALGADNKKHVARIQGATIEYAYGDEITTWSQDVFEMLKSRLRCEHSHFDGTCNPDDPNHWFKLFLDSDADIFQQAYQIDDNPYLPPDFVAQLKKEYAGTVYYQRYILGLWAAAEGVIYRVFADSLAAADGRFVWREKELPPSSRVYIGVDFGGNGSKHAFVASALLPEGAGVVGLQSARFEPHGNADALADAFIDFALSVFARFARIDGVFCDSAEQVLITHLRDRLRVSPLRWLADRTGDAKKIGINDRIRLTSILMGGGRFWLMPEAQTLSAALAAALWSDKRAGVDERLDDGSTDIDSLDAFEYTIERFRYELLRVVKK